ncbi:hypothetical protein IW262DRAFT_1465077 [Armillaria fumosa]|nr:hypothetical protein IW262DRAFT_1465077 [Armillaria fumosa]
MNLSVFVCVVLGVGVISVFNTGAFLACACRQLFTVHHWPNLIITMNTRWTNLVITMDPNFHLVAHPLGSFYNEHVHRQSGIGMEGEATDKSWL